MTAYVNERDLDFMHALDMLKRVKQITFMFSSLSRRNSHVNPIKQKRLDYLKEDLFVRALEYARMRRLGVRFENGCRVLCNFKDAEDQAKYMLAELGSRAEAILAEMSVVDGEVAAMNEKELAEYRKLKKDQNPNT